VSEGKPSSADKFHNSLETAESYGEVWQIVKDTVEYSLGKRRGNMMLFLDDLPMQLGAYHPLGTNNIVLNRGLIEIVEASMSAKHVVNSLVYNLLLHEYLHALGELSETEVRTRVIEVARYCFGEKHIATVIARKTPWVLLQNIPLQSINAPKRVMQIVKDFEKTGKYIV
jgi:diketogulonate reductase-like aldo/keto reductase